MPTRAMATEPSEAYVWTWLPGAESPVVAGVLRPDVDLITFTYARSYRERPDAVPLYLPELPLVRGAQRPRGALFCAGVILDGGPDGWGQRVVLDRRGHRHDDSPTELGHLTYLLESGSDRIGALDFQHSATEYVPREVTTTLEEILEATDRLLAGYELSPALVDALLRGTSIGGARPKVLLEDATGRGLIAKLSLASDPYPVVKAEGVAMRLARRAGLDVADVEVTRCMGRDVLLVGRFDRIPGTRQRRTQVSALTILELPEYQGHYATYTELADIIRRRFTEPAATLRELFSRIVFNVCVGNIDDHARNHAAFYDGRTDTLALTPAYDLCPQLRSGHSATQAMAFGRGTDGRPGERRSRLEACVGAAEAYLLSRAVAEEIVDAQVTLIREQWDDAADEAHLTANERQSLWERQILNPGIFYTD